MERGGEVMDIQWSLVLFTALTGMGGWLFFFICLNVFVRKTDKGAFAGTATALALTVVGGLASVTHLSHPDRMLGALQHPTSGIFTEALLVGLLAIVMIAFLVMLRRGIDGGALKAVAVVGMALGALMSFMAGQSYLMSAIAAWNTELLPLGYLGTAAASGAAAYLVLIAAQKADENACSLYGLMTLAAGCVALITVLAYGAVAGAFAGDAAPMTIAAAAFGGVAPIACGFLVRKKPGSAVALGAVALIAALIGSIAFRCAMWVIGAGLYDFFGLI
ncbi:DMSO reductase [Eggerthella lenta]|uniref:DMSO reductase n=2 Tax=Eggerthella lenta TaxID=84112 RepID=A0A369MUT5_EGGLN|nr:DMSO reductase [Eggerthella lenta]